MTLQRRALDDTTYITCLDAFTADGFETVSLPDGTYRLLMATATALFADITSITFGA